MLKTEKEDYLLNENYHGDVKLIRNNSKKVDLSKPTDTLEHKSKQSEILKVYTNKEKICLTKPQDLPIHYEDSFPSIDGEKTEVSKNENSKENGNDLKKDVPIIHPRLYKTLGTIINMLILFGFLSPIFIAQIVHSNIVIFIPFFIFVPVLLLAQLMNYICRPTIFNKEDNKKLIKFLIAWTIIITLFMVMMLE